MKSVVVTGYNKPLEIQGGLPIPEPKSSELLVKVSACSLCMSDIMGFQGYIGTAKIPYCPGHEPVGIVEKVGGAVAAFKVGDRVGWMPASRSCQSCTECISGNHRYCNSRINVGFDSTAGCGGFSEYSICDPQSTVKVPLDLKDEEAAPLLCAGITAWGAVKKVSQYLPGGSWLNVVGCGGVGHLVIQYATKMGYRVIASDIAQDKLDLAIKCGAFKTLNSKDAPESAITQSGCTVVVSGVAAAYDFGIKATSTGGKVIVIGVPHAPVAVDILGMVLREVSLITTNQGNKRELVEALEFAAQHGVKPIYEVKAMTAINEGVEDVRAGRVVGRIVYRWDM